MIDSRAEYKARVDATIMFMHEHMAENINLGELAKVANFSPYHFHRIFSSVTGETPQQYLMRIRLEMSANMLVKFFGYSITRIALECGFSSPATFARSFKSYFGISAREYRSSENKPMPHGKPLSNAQKFDLPKLEIKIKEVPDWNLAYVSNLQGYRIDLICKAWNQISKWAMAEGLLTNETYALGVSFDDPLITAPEKCRYYACLTIPEGCVPQPPIGYMRLAGSKCVVAHTTCRAEQIQMVYMHLYREWLVDSGYQPDNVPPYEVYPPNSPIEPSEPFNLDIYLPIVPL